MSDTVRSQSFRSVSYRGFTDPAHITKLEEAIRIVLASNQDVHRELTSARRSPSKRVALHFGIDGTTPRDIRHLKRVYTVFHTVYHALAGAETVVFVAISPDSWGAGKADMFVNRYRAFGSELEHQVNVVLPRALVYDSHHVAQTVLHEVAHLAGALPDFLESETYYDPNGKSTIGAKDRLRAMRNADSYAHFALPDSTRPTRPGLSGPRWNLDDLYRGRKGSREWRSPGAGQHR